MNTYDGVTLKPSDLIGGECGEAASSFNNVVFNPGDGGEDYEKINLSFAKFDGCTFNAKFKKCNFTGAEGDSLPQKGTIVFSAPPAAGKLVMFNRMLHEADGVQDTFEHEYEEDGEVYCTADLISKDDYTFNQSQVVDCNMNVGPGEWGDRSSYIQNRPKHLELTTDALDNSSPIDGIPDITANGTSTCTITVTKKDADGNVMTDASDVITLECSRGKLDALQKVLSSGTVNFTLTSALETCVSDLKAVSAEDNVSEGTIQIQFAP